MLAMRALVLAGVALLLAAPVRAQQAPADRPDPDPWFGRDKALHFAASASIAVAAYGGTSLATDDRPTRVVVSASVALGAGILKELWDLSGHGDASWRDLTWDVVGTTTGVLFAYAIDWAIARLRKPPPATYSVTIR
jgi:putative lipoprotein